MCEKSHLFYCLMLLFTLFSQQLPTTFGSYPLHDTPFNSLTSNLHQLNHYSAPIASPNIINVDDFGAKADGNDDSKAFEKAWKKACSSYHQTLVVVPKNKTYHLKPTKFSGPCTSFSLTFKVYGTIKASVEHSDYKKDRKHWIIFENVKNLRVDGNGVINGNGKTWWQKSCKINKSLPCQAAPTAVTFLDCRNLIVSNLWFQNSQQMHLSFQNCLHVKVSKLVVTAPRKSPNTDGIHITDTQHITLKNCIIRTGDDCISIVSGSKYVRASGITCGPGHGISIGSLGAGNSEAHVSNVVISNVKLVGTTNGVRIKTWQGGSGSAGNFVFQNIVMKNVTNPIIIDQNYCDRKKSCPEERSAVKISNVLYKNITGTSASNVAITFDCSKSIPCRGIYLQDVDLLHQPDEIATASCSNVKINTRGKTTPLCSSQNNRN